MMGFAALNPCCGPRRAPILPDPRETANVLQSTTTTVTKPGCTGAGGSWPALISRTVNVRSSPSKHWGNPNDRLERHAPWWDLRAVVRDLVHPFLPVGAGLALGGVGPPANARLFHHPADRNPDAERPVAYLLRLPVSVVPRRLARSAARRRARGIRVRVGRAGRRSAVRRPDAGGRGNRDRPPGDPGPLRNLPAGRPARIAFARSVRVALPLLLRRHGGADRRDFAGGDQDGLSAEMAGLGRVRVRPARAAAVFWPARRLAGARLDCRRLGADGCGDHRPIGRCRSHVT